METDANKPKSDTQHLVTVINICTVSHEDALSEPCSRESWKGSGDMFHKRERCSASLFTVLMAKSIRSQEQL